MFGGFATFAWLAWWRLGCATIEVDDERIIVRNPLRRYVLRRDEAVALATTSGNGWVVIVTKTGKRIVVFALSVGLRWTLRQRMGGVATSMGIELI